MLISNVPNSDKLLTLTKEGLCSSFRLRSPASLQCLSAWRRVLSPKMFRPNFHWPSSAGTSQTKTWRVGNLSTIEEDGTATYLAHGGQLANTVNAKGVVVPPSNRPANLDCYGKTLDQLRAMGRVVEFQRTR